MKNRSEFAHGITSLSTTHLDRAVAFLWYYRQSQEYEERSVSELAYDLHEEGFPRPNVTRLERSLRKTKYVISGRRRKSFQLDIRYLSELDEKYAPLLELRHVEVEDQIIPSEWVLGTRTYLEKIVHQINGSYQFGFYDACAVLSRRLMESLIIETYVSRRRHQEIQIDGVFIGLEGLINHITTDSSIPLNRSSYRTMLAVKEIGDVAAHDRTYIIRDNDIDDQKQKYRRLISELLDLSSIRSLPSCNGTSS
jgi:hypothetical protein